jgi:hypothetical protein
MNEKAKCSVEGCEYEVRAKGLCRGHYVAKMAGYPHSHPIRPVALAFSKKDPSEQTKLELWAKQFGVQNIVDAMRAKGVDYAVTYSAVYQWIRGEHEPRPKKIRALAEISGGAISVQDIHDHFHARAASLDGVLQ